ncbi:hypothetical protein Cs7R123_63190 [Catellatospora sp. TT07R-123]|nr:hypothetical protein Cs7R123_63190 [Catellatospora sp. TT07R-123]
MISTRAPHVAAARSAACLSGADAGQAIAALGAAAAADAADGSAVSMDAMVSRPTAPAIWVIIAPLGARP